MSGINKSAPTGLTLPTSSVMADSINAFASGKNSGRNSVRKSKRTSGGSGISTATSTSTSTGTSTAVSLSATMNQSSKNASNKIVTEVVVKRKYRDFHDSMVWFDDSPPNLWLDLTDSKMGIETITNIFLDLSHDSIVNLFSFSGNITAQDAYSASHMKELLTAIQKCLYKNRHLRILNASNNFLFLCTPSPQNEHTINYLAKLAEILADSTITKLDISRNSAIGVSGLQHTGLGFLVRKYIARQGKGFICR
jgi:hypothetical protein